MTRLILRDHEASAWHAGRLSAVVRLVKDQPPEGHKFIGVCTSSTNIRNEGKFLLAAGEMPLTIDHRYYRCPLGAPGNPLWIAETWAGSDSRIAIVYKANKPTFWRDISWRSPATMPRWASRYDAVHVGSRIVRVQAVTTEDAIACGAVETRLVLAETSVWSMQPWPEPICGDSAVNAFMAQFIADHGQAAWDRNEWVWIHRIGRE